MSHIDNNLIKVRELLRERNIKLWEEPYYTEGLGSIATALERLSRELSTELDISVSDCQCALAEMQDGALRKLAAIREFNETGMATFNVRCVESRGGTSQLMEIKCPMNGTGAELQDKVAQRLMVSGGSHIKIISAGRIIAGQQSLASQGLKNNQQLMVVLGQRGDEVAGEALHERIQKIRDDVLLIVESDRRFMEIEDQHGNPIFLPPAETRSLLKALSFSEKARAAMFRQEYDEALLLLLEGDEYFAGCSAILLERVDNYALINLDIVWCYLCLKNITELPDAQRRLEICEKNFRRTYGDNLDSFEEDNCPERALIMRLHLLQGVVCFHMNRRDEAYERLESAGAVLAELKVSPDLLQQMLNMGYNESDARVSLRATAGHLDRAVDFISERNEKLQEARNKSLQLRKVSQEIANREGWVCPKTVLRLMDMGYEQQLVVEALKRTKNNLDRSIDLLQHEADELRANLPATTPADETHLRTLQQLGFPSVTARAALETTGNNMEAAIQFLVSSLNTEKELLSTIEAMTRLLDYEGPSGSHAASPALIHTIIKQAKSEMESHRAFERFNEDVTDNSIVYLDLPLDQEEQILLEYKSLLER
ncbi:NEDD8 ultimate buster 1 [Drosophila obscura]|uniref:NEDD8 ultimate buster 1 n=1 Tax=Drosophila obscura TaxID=7282 RepID=UPI001BB2B8DF|nr:NEDD8 ultimate buster 1 [Drosophila obscura]